MEDFIKNYFDLITKNYAGINLTRITDYEEFKQKQIVDSIEPYRQSVEFKSSLDSDLLHIDVGFGGGFPLLPLAKTLPHKKFLGVETRNKKVKVVGEIAESLCLKNVKLYHSRIENIFIDTPVSISFKAVGKVNDFLEKINTDQKCRVFFYKGPNFYDLEKEQIVKAQKKWKIIEEKEICLDGVDKRYLIGFETKKVLHGTSNKRTNNLVILSHII
jgi:16S rRNA (guanine527-N7)-methyltransferase